MRGIGKRLVHILRSDSDPDRHYVAITSDVDNRLAWHNHGPSGHTVEHRPWSLVVVVEFPQSWNEEEYSTHLAIRRSATRWRVSPRGRRQKQRRTFIETVTAKSSGFAVEDQVQPRGRCGLW